MRDYKDRVVIITGAAHGIGLSLAKLYDQIGAKVVVIDVNAQALQEAEKILKNAVFYQCDITKKENVYELSKTILREVGVPYIIVNNAGVVENSYFLDCSDDMLERTMNVNIVSHFWICKAFLKALIAFSCSPRSLNTTPRLLCASSLLG